MTAHTRARGEGSIYPYRNGRYAAYVWVTSLTGERRRKYVYGDTRQQVHARWIELHHDAARSALATRSPRVADYLGCWLRDVVEPFAKPKTADTYTRNIRLYVDPYLGAKRLDQLSVADIRRWLRQLTIACQCCAQGKDGARAVGRQRCCAVGQCCEQRLSRRTIVDARAILRAALAEAVNGRLVSHNPAAAVRLPRARSRRMSAWTAEQARQFLANAHTDRDPLYPAYVLLLVLGLRRGELLGLQWTDIDLDAATIHVHRELQRIDGRLVLGETKTLDSDAGLPLPPLCVAALTQLAQDRDQACRRGTSDGGFVIATRTGTPVDPRNLYWSFQRRCAKAAVPRIPVHGTRHTCASLLVELDAHPRVAMQILRHAKIATTMDIYTHIPTRASRLALIQLSRQLECHAGPEAASDATDLRFRPTSAARVRRLIGASSTIRADGRGQISRPALQPASRQLPLRPRRTRRRLPADEA